MSARCPATDRPGAMTFVGAAAAVTTGPIYLRHYRRPRMRVAIDTTPLLGRLTGVGQAVQGLLSALGDSAPDIEVLPWELTRRSMPVPPRALLQLWQRADRPRADRWLPPADVVHGTNFVVPPVRGPSTVTVHD